jgi:hypothetical protein
MKAATVHVKVLDPDALRRYRLPHLGVSLMLTIAGSEGPVFARMQRAKRKWVASAQRSGERAS